MKRFHPVATLILVLISVLIIVPLCYIASISLSSDADIIKYGYQLFPANTSFDAYKFIFAYPEQILQAYLVSIVTTVLGTTFGLCLSTPLAYVLTRKDFRYKKGLNTFVFFPLIFNAGVVPFYLVITQVLGIQNTIFALFIPYGISVWFTFLLKGFMSSMPFELIESAKIDGASELATFFKIILPLNTAGLATVGLFYAFSYWNDWWLAMLFIDNQKLVPIQLYLYQTLNTLDMLLRNLSSGLKIPYDTLPGESVRMAVALLAVWPMLVVFPFVQRFFVKGITLGAVKG